MNDNVYHASTSYFRPDIPTDADVGRLRRMLPKLDVQPSRWVELLDVLLRDRRQSRGPGFRFLQGAGALAFAIASGLFVPYPWTYLMMLPAGLVAMWWLGISFAHYRNTEQVRGGAKQAQQSLENSDGLLWRFEPLLLKTELRAGIRLFGTLLPTCTASRNGTLRADLVSLRDYWYWIMMTETVLDERELMLGRRPV